MTGDPAKADQPTQKTPTGHEIPVPKKADFLRDLKKVAPPAKQEPRASNRKG